MYLDSPIGPPCYVYDSASSGHLQLCSVVHVFKNPEVRIPLHVLKTS